MWHSPDHLADAIPVGEAELVEAGVSRRDIEELRLLVVKIEMLGRILSDFLLIDSFARHARSGVLQDFDPVP